MTKKRTIIYLLVLNAVLLAVWCAGYYYVNGKAVELAIERSTADAGKRSDEERAAMRQTLKETAAARAELSDYIVTTATTPDFLEEVSAIAQTSEVEYGLDGLKQENGLRLTLHANGSFANCMKFISALASLPYKIAFNHTSFSLVTTEAGETVWNVNTSITIKSFKP